MRWGPAGCLADTIDRRRLPAPVEHAAPRPVDPHRDAKASARGRQPIDVGAAGARPLDQDDDAAGVLTPQRRMNIADRGAMRRVGDQEAIRVVERQRPERAIRWRLAGLEHQPVVVGAVERLAGGVGERGRIDGLLPRVGAEPELGDLRTEQPIVGCSSRSRRLRRKGQHRRARRRNVHDVGRGARRERGRLRVARELAGGRLGPERLAAERDPALGGYARRA